MKIPDAALFLKNFHQLSLFQVLEVPKSLLSYISFGTKQSIKHLSFVFSLFINIIASNLLWWVLIESGLSRNCNSYRSTNCFWTMWKYVLFTTGVPNPWARPTTGPWPILNWAMQVAGRSMCMYVQQPAWIAGWRALTHMCISPLLTQVKLHASPPLAQSLCAHTGSPQAGPASHKGWELLFYNLQIFSGLHL